MVERSTFSKRSSKSARLSAFHEALRIVPWCNGSTSDFGSASPGSNPSGTTNETAHIAYYQLFAPFSFSESKNFSKNSVCVALCTGSQQALQIPIHCRSSISNSC